MVEGRVAVKADVVTEGVTEVVARAVALFSKMEMSFFERMKYC